MTNYIYTPNSDNEFKCKVPLDNTVQLFVVDGVLQSNSIDAISGIEGGGYCLKVVENRVVDQMLQVISVRSRIEKRNTATDAGDEADALQYTNRFELEKSAQAKLLLCSHTLNEYSFVTEEQFEIKLAENSILDLVIMQNEHENSRHNSRFMLLRCMAVSCQISLI